MQRKGDLKGWIDNDQSRISHIIFLIMSHHSYINQQVLAWEHWANLIMVMTATRHITDNRDLTTTTLTTEVVITLTINHVSVTY